KVVATGCAAQMGINKSEPMEAADLVVPNPSKLDTLSFFSESFPLLLEHARSEAAPPSLLKGRTRATVKIQDGCSVYCSYCSIPYTRPGMTSRGYREVIQEVEGIGKR